MGRLTCNATSGSDSNDDTASSDSAEGPSEAPGGSQLPARCTSCIQDGKVTVFSYGSNSTAQLSARVENPNLKSKAAELQGFARVFCLSSEGWQGGVASLAPAEGCVTYGAVVELTLEEKARLDEYEGGYREEVVDVHVAGTRRPALVYVAGEGRAAEGAPYTEALSRRPSEAYLCAIHVMLLEAHGPAAAARIAIASCQEDGEARQLDQWEYPGAKNLSLEGFCVLMNARKRAPWVMPGAIPGFVARLAACGYDPEAPAEQLWKGAGSINFRLAGALQEPLDPDTLQALNSLVQADDEDVTIKPASLWDDSKQSQGDFFSTYLR